MRFGGRRVKGTMLGSRALCEPPLHVVRGPLPLRSTGGQALLEPHSPSLQVPLGDPLAFRP